MTANSSTSNAMNERCAAICKIGRAQLGRNMFRLELASEPAETVQITFQADRARYNQLRRVLNIMVPSGVLKIE
jgi:hypothetical protein